MRILCLMLAHLPLQVEIQRTPLLAGEPLALLRPWDQRVIMAALPLRTAGVRPGDSRKSVKQRCPHTRFLLASEAHYQQAHQYLENAVRMFSKHIESNEMGKFFIEATVLSRTFKSETALAKAVTKHIRSATQLPATASITGDKFTAYCAALQANPACAIPEGKEASFLADLPLTALPDPPPEMLCRLHLFGINTMGELARLPHQAVVNQFGRGIAHFHDLAQGRDTRPLQPYVPPPVVMCNQTLLDPLDEFLAAENSLQQLAEHLAKLLEQKGYQATALALGTTDENDQEHHQGVSLKPPTAEKSRLQRTAIHLLNKLNPQIPISTLQLTAYPLQQWQQNTTQMHFFQQRSIHTTKRLKQALSSLQQRFGNNVIQRASAIESPEPSPVQVSCAPNGNPATLRLHEHSYPIECVHQHWRVQHHWWAQPIQRDYFQVSITDGRVLNLFCESTGTWFIDHAIH